MTRDKRLRAHCDALGEDDGVDPREYFRTTPTGDKNDRKARQLCRQVAETLDQVLSGEIHDDLANSLRVASVVPAPDSSRLLVTVACDLPVDRFDRAELERRLGDLRGLLRCAIAGVITRRKTPNLVFNILDTRQVEATSPREEAL